MLSEKITVPGLGTLEKDSDINEIDKTSDGTYKVGECGVEKIFITSDKKEEFIVFPNKTLAYVPSAMGYSAYYPVPELELERPIEGVLMDLDGTSVKSEEFWMWIIESCVAKVTKNKGFQFEQADIPFISGNCISEHLYYCIEKYCPDVPYQVLRDEYFSRVEYEMREIMEGRGKDGAFTPAEGLKDLLLSLKEKNIKIGLVTSGLYEKAMPEIISAFKTLKMGDPVDFYDAIITAGTTFSKGQTSTLTELPVKPHPWLYAETGQFGLKIPFERRNRVVAIEDSGAGICSARLAGYYTIGVGGGNIEKSGTKFLCGNYFDNLIEAKDFILG